MNLTDEEIDYIKAAITPSFELLVDLAAHARLGHRFSENPEVKSHHASKETVYADLENKLRIAHDILNRC